ncbi:hypothetical protein GWI33_014551 [Rhynchophorus ferrugineus]|uniref:Nucleolar protein 6 n=1 Tax=Rhynchophorus ferrugineus TaxID=354439 RepID=A0A834I180_RHYFE|nr:hypothetical protein GWI33_014551 [Rhynchophorus ferrugineus]
MDSMDEDEDTQEAQTSLVLKPKRAKNLLGNKLKKVKYSDMSEKPKGKGIKIPTAEELNNLRETENLYNNNLFRLQISELLKEVQIKNKRKTSFKNWFESFKESIQSMPELDDFTLSEIKEISKKKRTKTEKFINSVSKYPCYLKTDQDLTLKLNKPEECECFGLQEVNASPGPSLNINIRVNMPRSYFNVKDFVNNRYLVKRFYYLLYILENVDAVKKDLTLHEDVPLLPVLNLQPTDDVKIKVNVYVVPPKNYFKPARFLPSINNVKCHLFMDKHNEEVLKETPTVLYNAAIAHDVTLQTNNDYIQTVLNDYPNIQDALKLLCVWLNQRELNVGFGGLKPSLLMSLVVFLVGVKKINKMMSAYQVVRNVWCFLADTDLTAFPICLGDCTNEIIESFKENFSVVFLDYTGCFNLAAFLSSSIAKKISRESQIAVKQLDSGKMESFQLLFLNKLPFCLQYDMVVDISPALPLPKFDITDKELWKSVGFEFVLKVKYLSSMLERALHERAVHIVPRIETRYSTESDKCLEKLLIGINVNAEKAFNFIEKGPALSDHIEAEKFRQFWGELSSDRRFRDGSTNVAVYFKANTVRAKRNIVKRIVKFVLNDKLQLRSKIHYDEMDEFVINKRLKAPYPVGTNEETCLKAMAISDELGSMIRKTQTSLIVTAVLGVSDTLCLTDPCGPIASNIKPEVNGGSVCGRRMANENSDGIQRYLKAIDLVIHLEHSSKWPNDLQAVRYIKTSFYLEISSQLKRTHNISSVVTQDVLCVYYKGLVFRFTLYVPKEIALLKKGTTELGAVQYLGTADTFQMERDLLILPRIMAGLRGLQYNNPSFGASCGLIKKWIRSQLIDHSHITDIQVDLLNASVYLRDSPYLESATPQIAFLRFLQYLKELQWDLQPVPVNFNGELSKEDLLELESKFQQNRDKLAPLYFLMAEDKGESVFTNASSPSQQILIRLQQLADAALTSLTRRLTGDADFDLYSLFAPNMEGYNLIIHLKPEVNARRYESIGSNKEGQVLLEPFVQKEDMDIPLFDFNPVDLYLDELRRNYSEYATFFHNSYGGNTIGILWDPLENECEFKVTNISGRKLVDQKLVLNIDAFIEDFYLLGRDIVKWIEKK